MDDFKLFFKLINMLNSFAKFTFITLHGFGIIDSNHLIRFPKEHMKLICDNITYLVIYFDLLDDHIGYISLSFSFIMFHNLQDSYGTSYREKKHPLDFP